MATFPSISRPASLRDRRQLQRSAIAGAVSMVLGLAAAHASLDRHTPRQEAALTSVEAEETSPPLHKDATSAAKVTTTPPEKAPPTLPKSADEQRESSGAASTSPESPPEPDAEGPLFLGAGEFQIEAGRVAYFRCPGLEDDKGRCPRDRTLEMSLWKQLWRLPHCTSAQVHTGIGELELALVQGQATKARIRKTRQARSLLAKAPRPTSTDETGRETNDEKRALQSPLRQSVLDACIGPQLAKLQDKFGAKRLFVSFRFQIRRRGDP